MPSTDYGNISEFKGRLICHIFYLILFNDISQNFKILQFTLSNIWLLFVFKIKVIDIYSHLFEKFNQSVIHTHIIIICLSWFTFISFRIGSSPSSVLEMLRKI